MTREQYESLANGMEALSRRDPQAYRKKVRSWVQLGNVVYLLIGLITLVLLIALVVGWVTGSGRGRGSVFVIFIAFALIVPLFRRFPKPDGVPLNESEAPHLFRELEELRKSMLVPKIDEVLLLAEANAFAAKHQDGFFSRPRLLVGIGAPLLANLPPEELKGVLAHELAHHRQGDVTENLRLAIVMDRWDRFNEMAGSMWILFPITWFLRWYYPRLQTVSLVLQRQAEFEADGMAAKFVGAAPAAQGLARLCAINAWVEALGRSIPSNASVSQQWSTFARGLRSPDSVPLNMDALPGELASRLRSSTTLLDSHPSLGDRVTALGYPEDRWPELEAAVLEGVQESAAKAFCGEGWESAIKRLVEPNLPEGGEEAEEDTHRVSTDLDDLPTYEHRMIEASRLAKNHDHAAAAAIYRELLEERPDDRDARYLLCDQLGEMPEHREEALNILAEMEKDLAYRAKALRDRQWLLDVMGRRQEAYDLTWKVDEAEAEMQELFSIVLDVPKAKSDPRPHPRVLANAIAEQARKVEGVKLVISTWQSSPKAEGVRVPTFIVVFDRPRFILDENALRDQQHEKAVELQASVELAHPGISIAVAKPPKNLDELRDAGAVLYERSA